VLDAYLDRREGREGCEDGEERCNVCRGLDEEIEEIEEGSSEDSSNTRAIKVVARQPSGCSSSSSRSDKACGRR
jgi:hypothetical protein